MVGYELILRIKDEQGHLHEVVHKTGRFGNGEAVVSKHPELSRSCSMSLGQTHQDTTNDLKHQTEPQKAEGYQQPDQGSLVKLEKVRKAVRRILTELGICSEELEQEELEAQIQEAFQCLKNRQNTQAQNTQKALEEVLNTLALELEMEDWEEKDDMANKKRKLKDKIKKLKEECKEWKDKAGKVSGLKGDLEMAEAEVKRLEGELGERDRKIIELRTESRTFETQAKTLQTQKEDAEGERNRLQKEKEQLDIDYQTLKDERDELQAKLDKEEQKVKDKDQEVADAQKQAQAYKDFEPLKELFEIAKQGSIPSLVVRHLEEFLYDIYADLDYTLDTLAKDIAEQCSKNKGDLDNPQLQEFFDTLFGLVGEKMGLERLRVQEGESYNSGLCRKLDQSMPTQGKITQVHFQGYKQKGKVKHASSVSVK
ncbi:coiled-coil domain-containing protein [Helicobacter bizzozeronii]|uniref:hypothetical protein n=1 Tax=Helicobacter bizzozeronii TaxID=56877 RepID=UPI001F35DFCF|nr:hypothetical protein [Helicobacter bizzozeronii]